MRKLKMIVTVELPSDGETDAQEAAYWAKLAEDAIRANAIEGSFLKTATVIAGNLSVIE